MSRDHLISHDLDPSKGATLPETSIDLPPLQGNNIDEHFYHVGSMTAEPTRTMAKNFSTTDLPPLPDDWVHEPGWTKYHRDGSFEHVEDLGSEELITFDVETMPNHSPYAVMACAATPNAWYTWLSPWLLGLDPDPLHLIPIGSPKRNRLIVGHNVSYDRARIAEEYNIERTNTNFIDTMALHVAVRGISSPQRPTWMKWRKDKREQEMMNTEAIASLRRLAQQTEARARKEKDASRRQDLQREMAEMMDSISQLGETDDDAANENGLSWENVSSLSSLAEVGWLYCGIDLSKEPRGDFMKLTPEQIRADLDSYISYCAQDVRVTHSVFTKVLPLFLQQCPHPVSFAGMSVMGSSFLPVNESWQKYIESAESTYRASEAAIFTALRDLAVAARELFHSGEWKKDAWLSQLDWTPKIPRQNRLEANATNAPPTISEERASTLNSDVEKDVITDNARFGMRIDGKYGVPAWLHRIASMETLGPSDEHDLGTLLDLTFRSRPVRWSPVHGWIHQAPHAQGQKSNHDSLDWQPLPRSESEHLFGNELLEDIQKSRIRSGAVSRKELTELVNMDKMSSLYRDRIFREASRLVSARRSSKPTLKIDVARCEENMKHPVYSQLDWTPEILDHPPSYIEIPRSIVKSKASEDTGIIWPKWYYDLAAPKASKIPGTLDLTPRTRASILLLRLSWRGFPLFHSRQHGWTFRVDKRSLKTLNVRQPPLSFDKEADAALQADMTERQYTFFKLPHKDGDDANVGSPLSKTFLPYAMDGTLASPNELAAKALQMNAECSYWISARERIMSQMIVHDTPGKAELGITNTGAHRWGMIVPQVVTMGTITRRAMERTWLTASNAKKNRVGSELKAMVRAPPGYAIVGADVDSEELWISSVMGDSQFGLHGASAIGWMTLEGTKSQGTDLHSKTAKILGITRDQAKIFNYSRIYGAGKRHAELLLLQSNPSLSPQAARALANDLYASTKGKKTRRKEAFGKAFWYGGTESFVFNRLEQIAVSAVPKTPALGCGITSALTQQYLVESADSDFMPSRINWAVQSSGVDYLHLLLVTMEYLMQRYNIRGRYMISVHDEVRYLVQEEDKYRLALALQIANLWTRSLFVYRLGFDNLPQGVAFFSAVDIDHVLRKEVDMTCITPSHPTPILPGQSLDIYQLLKELPEASLGVPITKASNPNTDNLEGYVPHDGLKYRAQDPEWLQAQATKEHAEVLALWRRLQARTPEIMENVPITVDSYNENP